MFEGFVNPALAFGAALAAVPLIIHLLNRARHKPMPWAAMRFVLAAYRKTKKRARLENLLLLFLRMAAVALLALALSRPFAGKQNPLVNLTETRRDVALVIDGSASTGYRDGAQSVFERIVERAKTLVRDLDPSRGDRVRVLFAGKSARLLSWRSPEEALDVLGALREPTDDPLDLASALGEVAAHAEEEAAGGNAAALEVRLLCDLQKQSFATRVEGATEGDARLYDVLERLGKLQIRVLVEDLGASDPMPHNLAITELEPAGALLGVDVPIDVDVAIANFGPAAATGVRVALEVDGERKPSKLVGVPSRGEAKVVFPVTFKSPGSHTLIAKLEGDRLAIDDTRAWVVQVPPPVRVLLVDGEPADQIERDEVGYLAAVLAPIDAESASLASATPFEARVVEPAALRDGGFELGDFDVIWLANVDGLAEATVERIEKLVAAGVGLIVSVGAQVQLEVYNKRMFRADGSGLLPAELGRRVAVASRREQHYRAKELDPLHPALAFFADERWKPLFSEVPVYEFLAARPIERARVLATLDDEAQSPLLIERRFDRGAVLLWTTTIDTDWNRLPESPRSLVPFVHELVRYAGRRDGGPRNVGTHRELALELASFPKQPTLVKPDGSRTPLAGEPAPLGPGLWRLPPVADTARVGLYKIELEGEPAQPFAVQLDPTESDLERLAGAELATLHPVLQLVSSFDSGERGDAHTDAPRGELWRWLAAACLLALIAESLWSAFLGRKRSLR